MKPVTIETVRERLSYLEGLNERGVGTAVSQQQFETACLRELLTLLDEQEAAEKRIAELEARKYIPQPLDIEDEYQNYEYVAGWNDCRNATACRFEHIDRAAGIKVKG
ncbi:hypothetical protein LHT88_003613 [Salmonella enterica]|nr:hypothetical protein [Salmonella enterica]